MTFLTIAVARRRSRSLTEVLALASRPELVLGVLGAVIAFAGSWIPSYWGDEGASVMSAERSVGSILHELTAVDAVHGVYYLALHAWVGVFGASELSTRLPSAIAIGFAVSGTVVLGRRLWGGRVGWLAGVLALLIPELTNLGMETRSYACSMAVMVWMTVLVLRLRRRGTRNGWLAYGIVAAAAAYLYLYLLLMIVVHALLLLCLRTTRPMWRRFATASAVAIGAASPMLAVAYLQRGQIAFLESPVYATPRHVLVSQWFDQPWAAAVAWALVLVGLVWVLARRSAPRRAVLGRRWLATAALAFGVTAMLLAGDLVTPLYNLRYASSAIPAVAVLMAVGAAGAGRMLRGRRGMLVSAIAAAVFLAAATPSYLAQRTPFGKDGSDLREVAGLLQKVSHPGEAIVFDDALPDFEKPRIAMRLYPTEFRHLDDVELVKPYYDRAGVWDEVSPVSELARRVAGHRVVWAVEVIGRRTPDLVALQAAGYTAVAWHPIHRDDAIELVRVSAPSSGTTADAPHEDDHAV